MSMELWGANVPSNRAFKVNLRPRELVHLSQVSLDLCGYDEDKAIIRLEVGEKGSFVIGCLSKQKTAYMSLDLIVDKSFKLSHSHNKGSVHFVGYKTSNLVSGPGKNAAAEDKALNLVSDSEKNGAACNKGNKGKNLS